jgi:inner membrane protein
MATLIAHALAGLVTLAGVRALTGNRVELTPATLLLAACAGCLPDLDLVPSYLLTGHLARLHGGPTHSLAFALLAGVVAHLTLQRSAARRALALTVGLAVASHPMIDLFTGPALGLARSYGTPLFWPLHSDRISMPLTLFKGVKHGSVSIWFTWVNLRVALLEVAMFAPPALLALALSRKRVALPNQLDARGS